jgi:hypothetical protein
MGLSSDLSSEDENVIPEELVRAVRVIAAGDSLLAPTVTTPLIEAFARQAPTPPAPAALKVRNQQPASWLARARSAFNFEGEVPGDAGR